MQYAGHVKARGIYVIVPPPHPSGHTRHAHPPDSVSRAGTWLRHRTQVREEVRDAWLGRWLRDFVYDLRFSARAFLRSPSFTATAVISLALGIGATATIYPRSIRSCCTRCPCGSPSGWFSSTGKAIRPA